MSELQVDIERHLEELEEQGVTVIPDQFKEGTVDRIREDLAEFTSLNRHLFDKHLDADGHYPRIINLHLAFPELLRLYTENPIALGVQDAFFNAESSVYTTLYYERGSAQPIHRDTPYFCTRPELRYLGVWVAMEEANDLNGCLNIIRGGHLVPEFDREKIALSHFDSLDDVPPASDVLWNEYQSMVADKCAELGLKVEQLEVEKGDTVIWHPQLPHGGSPITDITRTRHSLVVHVAPVGCPVYYQDVFFNPGKPRNVSTISQHPA